jgi:hypothetical protein
VRLLRECNFHRCKKKARSTIYSVILFVAAVLLDGTKRRMSSNPTRNVHIIAAFLFVRSVFHVYRTTQFIALAGNQERVTKQCSR